MIRSAIRLVVHALFGVGLLSAFAAFDRAEAGKIGSALTAAAVKVGSRAVTKQLRGSSDTDNATASATSQSQSPKVLNRWDMQRKSDETPQIDSTPATDTEHERPIAAGAPASAPQPAGGPVVVTVPNATAGVQVLAVPAAAIASTTVPAPRETAENQVICLAGCR